MKGELAVEKVIFDVIESLEAPEPVAALCLGIAGVGQPGSDQVIHDVLRRLGQRQTIRVVNDALVALVAGAPSGVGIVVVAGTGSIAYGVDPAGQRRPVPAVGDFSSGTRDQPSGWATMQSGTLFARPTDADRQRRSTT